MQLTPKAVIFDYGNVLCAPQQSSDMEQMAAVFSVPQSDFFPVYWKYRLPYDQLKFDATSYWSTVARDLKRDLNPADIERLTRLDVESWSRPAACMPEWARDLRAAGMRTGLLSNMPMDLRVHVTRSDSWLPPFDHMTFSCDVRLVKPDPAIYKDCLAGLGIGPEDALFLDDRPENIEAAENLGMHGILFKSPDAAKAAMAGKYALPLSLEC